MIGTKTVVLIDEKDNVIGYKDRLEVHKNPVPLHRAISVVIFNSAKDSILLQKRSDKKPTWPLFWSNACCSHPRKGESYSDAAERRLTEELGFTVKLKEIARIIYEARMDEIWGEHELDVVFTGIYEGEVKANPDEVEDFKWMKITDVKHDIKENPQKYTPWFRLHILKML